MIVLDTNIISELMRPDPAPRVIEWWHANRAADLTTTAVNVAEIRYGIARLGAGRRQRQLADLAAAALSDLPGSILPFDLRAAEAYVDIRVVRESAGCAVAEPDVQIAAICRVHQASLATRNIRDFALVGLDLVDPWGQWHAPETFGATPPDTARSVRRRLRRAP